MEWVADLFSQALLGMGGWLGVVGVYVSCNRAANMLTRNRFSQFLASAKDLHSAANDDCVSRVIELLDKGAEIDALDKKGRTPLFSAISGESYVNAWLLLSRGADPNVPDKEGCTPLHFACELADMAAVQLLVGYGADPHARNKGGDTPGVMLEATEAWLVDRAKVSIIRQHLLEQPVA